MREAAVEGIPASTVFGLEWPALPSTAGQTMLAAQYQFERSQWWSPDDLAGRVLDQLRALCGYALDCVPYYREHPDRPRPDPRSLTWESFAGWPLLKKSDLRDHETALLASPLPAAHGQLFWHATTGSTGVPVRVASTMVAQFFRSALTMRNQLWHGLDFSLKYCEIKPETERTRGASWGAAPAVAYRTGRASSLNVAASLAEQLDWLIEEAPGYLHGKGSNLRALLLLSREDGRKPAGLDALLPYSENLPADLRALAREIWDARVIDTYSCGEAGILALQCPTHEHYHAQAEAIHLEVLRDDGTPCGVGEIGKVVITDLTNFGMPLIRYELGDYAEVGAPCPCGRGLPVLERLMGRERNMAVDPEGRTFWPSFPANFWYEAAPVRQVQLVQHTPASIEMRYVMERDLTPAECENIATALSARMRYGFDYRFSRVAAIIRKPGEKFEDFICLCPPPPRDGH